MGTQSDNLKGAPAKHLSDVSSIALLPGELKAVTGGVDGRLILWEIKTGQPVRVIDCNSAWIEQVFVTHEGNAIVANCMQNMLVAHHHMTGRELFRCSGSGAVWGDLQRFPNKDIIVSASKEMVIVWDIERGVQLASLEGHNGLVCAVAVTSNGDRIASGSRDTSIKIWDTKSMSEVCTLCGHTDWVSGIWIAPDDRYLISSNGGMKKTMRGWNLEKKREVWCHYNDEGATEHVAFIPSTAHAAISTVGSPIISIWNYQKGEMTASLKDHSGDVNDIKVNSNGTFLLSAANDRTVRLWDLGEMKAVSCFTGDSSMSVCSFVEKRKMIIAGEKTGRVHFLRV